jgi:hypothetical protein
MSNTGGGRMAWVQCAAPFVVHPSGDDTQSDWIFARRGPKCALTINRRI